MPKENPSEFSPQPQRLELKQVEVQDRSTIASLFQELTFPVTKLEALQVCGDCELLWTDEEPIMVSDVLVEIPQERFESLVDLVDAICSTIRLAYGDYSVENQAPIIEE